MPRVAFWKTIPRPLRARLDQEIRRRGYGDLRGLAAWLSEQWMPLSHNAVYKYVRHLREADKQKPPDQSLEDIQTLADCVRMLNTALIAFQNVLTRLDRSSMPNPQPPEIDP